MVRMCSDNRQGDNRLRSRVIARRSADVVAGDQASPFPWDWDGDGDWDLGVGGGNGWPTVILNEGTDRRPRFALPRQIPSESRLRKMEQEDARPGFPIRVASEGQLR